MDVNPVKKACQNSSTKILSPLIIFKEPKRGLDTPNTFFTLNLTVSMKILQKVSSAQSNIL